MVRASIHQGIGGHSSSIVKRTAVIFTIFAAIFNDCNLAIIAAVIGVNVAEALRFLHRSINYRLHPVRVGKRHRSLAARRRFLLTGSHWLLQRQFHRSQA